MGPLFKQSKHTKKETHMGVTIVQYFKKGAPGKQYKRLDSFPEAIAFIQKAKDTCDAISIDRAETKMAREMEKAQNKKQ